MMDIIAKKISCHCHVFIAFFINKQFLMLKNQKAVDTITRTSPLMQVYLYLNLLIKNV